MANEVSSATAQGAAALQIDEAVLQLLREQLAGVAADTVAAVTAEVSDYAGALSGSMGANIEAAVQMALAGFLKLAAGAREADPSTPLGPALDGAYALGRGEARSGRSMDALLAAYRVGARVSWRELARTAGAAGLDAETMARFAELVFAYIDELSAASVAGHTDELTTSGRVRERYRERLGQLLLAGARPEVLAGAAERAEWTPPGTVTAVLLPAAQARGALVALSRDTLQVGEDLPGTEKASTDLPLTLLLVPDVDGSGRAHLVRVLLGRNAVVGPARSWTLARSSYDRALRTLALLDPDGWDGPVDTEDHLAALVLSADAEALADLQARALTPLRQLPQSTRQRLAETLLSWLLHQGRREEVAAELHVHPQTVRYRMGQVRDAYGDRLADPATVRDLVLVLSADAVRRAAGSPDIEAVNEPVDEPVNEPG